MSHVNVTGVVKNHGTRSNIYTPLIEAVVNSIQAIEDRGIDNGRIVITLKREVRSSQLEGVDRSKPDITSIEVRDNGIGFNEQNRNSFDTFYSMYKEQRGGKGFGRFMYKKYFEHVKIVSVFNKDNVNFKRTFNFGDEDEIIDKDTEELIKLQKNDSKDIETTLYLEKIKQGSYPKELETIAKNILEKLLIYFISDAYNPPEIILQDEDGKTINLNKLVTNSKEILLINETDFKLINPQGENLFKLKIFKVFSPNNQNSKIILTADKREVTETSLYEYIPEFKDEFFDKDVEKGTSNNYIIKAYVLGSYLDNNVNVERDGFKFEDDKDLFHKFCRRDIEEKSLSIIEENLAPELSSRKEKKYAKVDTFLEANPWYRHLKSEINWNSLPINPNEEEIDTVVHKINYEKERKAKVEINEIIKNFDGEIPTKINEVFAAIDSIKKSELAHYVSLRKVFLSIFRKALNIKSDSQKHEKEDLLHNIIFPTKKDSDDVKFMDHNLWILDERLNFVEYLRSDMPLSSEIKRRPDVVVFDKRVAFRTGDEPSNPITIFEFKRPSRDDFTNKSSNEDPYDQLLDYVESIKAGKFTTPDNRQIKIGDNTPFYGYIIADKTSKVEKWLIKNDFTPLPNNETWFKWQKQYNLYIEFITWDQLLTNAELRHKIFFQKLGI